MNKEVKDLIEKLEMHLLPKGIGFKKAKATKEDMEFLKANKNEVKAELEAAKEAKRQETLKRMEREDEIRKSTVHKKKIAEAKEAGHKVVLKKYTVNSNGQSDTAIVTEYIDENGKITVTKEEMH